MPTIRERITDWALGDEKRRMEETAQALARAYRDGPFVLPPEQLVAQLREYDSALLTDLVNQIYYEQIGTLGYAGDTGAERTRAAKESARLWKYSPLASWNIWLWTNYGLGETIVVTPEDEAAQETWNEFWTADRNQPVLAADEIHDLSNGLLVQGNQFLAFYGAEADGKATVRRVAAEEIVEIVTDPDDSSVPLFYKRQWTPKGGEETMCTWYYPAWMAYFSGVLDEADKDGKTLADRVLPRGAIRADLVNAASDGNTLAAADVMGFGTGVCMLHIAHNQKEEGSPWGWPLLTASAPWDRAHKKFREDRAAVAATAAMFVQKLKHKGGSRAGASIRTLMQSALSQSTSTETNPPAVAGSTFIENEAATLERLPMGTGAGDAKQDGEGLAWMACLGAGVFPHYAGMGDAYRLATASAMERPLEMQFSRYQLFWSAQFRKIVRIVLQYKEKYTGVKFSTYEAEVSTDRLVAVDLVAVSGAVSQLYRDVVLPLFELNALTPEVVTDITARILRLALQALGITDVDEVASDEAFEPPEPEEEEAPPPPPVPEEEEPAPAPEEEAIEAIVRVARENLEAARITAEQAAEFALGMLIDGGMDERGE